MEDNALVQSSFSARIHAPIEKVDIPAWCFGLSEAILKRSRCIA
jgi:hypothetical protein